MDEVRYPIGAFVPIDNLSVEERKKCINQIPGIIESLKSITKSLTNDQLQIPYRPHGWTIQQLVHHMADNDMNAFIRFKRALTEDEPVANSYREDLWAELSDYKDVPIEISIQILESIHTRFFILLKGINSDEFRKRFSTQALGFITLDIALQRFVWHNQHHISQINSLIKRMKWNT